MAFEHEPAARSLRRRTLRDDNLGTSAIRNLQTVRLKITDGRGPQVVIPESAAPQRAGGGLVLESHSRTFTFLTPNGQQEVRALTVFLVNRRAIVHRFYADVSFVFQAQIELVCPDGFRPRVDLSGYRAEDFELRVAD